MKELKTEFKRLCLDEKKQNKGILVQRSEIHIRNCHTSSPDSW